MKRVMHRRPAGVARTAVLIAAARANEQRHLERLFDDPLAGPLVKAAGEATDLSGVRNLAGDHFVLRTRYFDDYLDAAGHLQVVIMASGLDTRAYRLPWRTGTTVFEIDLPDLLGFKQQALDALEARPTCERVAVPCDLREDWPKALFDAGFDPRVPTAWLLEGLLMFLPPDAVDQLMRLVGGLSAPGSRIALEHVNRAFRDLPQMRAVHDRFDQLDARWQSDVENPVEWLREYGWESSVTPQTELAARHNRPVPAITDPGKVGDARIWLVEGIRNEM